MLQPKRVKYRKVHRGRRSGIATAGNTVLFGEFGLKALEPFWVTARQIEAARIALSRSLSKGGRMWVRVFPDKAVTKKPAETRQGGGKGAVDRWVAVVKPGLILFEVGGIRRDAAKEALRLASHKLPIATRMVSRDPLAVEEATEEVKS
jgi:large subunit ribosomal protein L16